jgi:hypothetical protein
MPKRAQHEHSRLARYVDAVWVAAVTLLCVWAVISIFKH